MPKLGPRAQAMWNTLKPPKINGGMLDFLQYTVLFEMQDNIWTFQSTRENCAVLRQIWLRERSSHCWRWVWSASANCCVLEARQCKIPLAMSCFLKADMIVTPKLGSCPHGHMQCEMHSNHRKSKGGLWWSTYPDGSFSHHKKSIMTLFGVGWLFGHASPRPPVLTCLAANLACEERSSTSAKPSTIIKTEISNVMEPSKRCQNRLMIQFHFLPVTSC